MASSKRKMPAKERIARYVTVLGEALDDYEKTHPNWRAQALFWLIDYGLLNLRHYVESKTEKQITWDSPFLELHYPIDWNWESWRKGKTTGISINTGVFTEANTRTKKSAVKTVAKIMVEHITIFALQEFTRNVGYEKKGNRFTPILTSDLSEILSRTKGKRRQRDLLDEWFHPFSIGAGTIHIDEECFKPNAPMPASVVRELARSTALIDLPPIEWTGQVDGRPFRILLIFQIHPFVVDLDKRSAHFPITVGLHIDSGVTQFQEGQIGEIDGPWLNPKNWTQADRASIWEAILGSLRSAAAKDLTPPPSREVAEAILSVTAKIKVSHYAGDVSSHNQIVREMMETFSKTGQVIQLECDPGPAELVVEKLMWSNISDEDFERLLFTLVSSSRGYENAEWLTDTNAADRGRDLSVFRTTKDPLMGSRRLRVVIQCKHKKSIGLAEIAQLKEQMRLWEPPRIDELIIATSGRFTTDAVEWIEKLNLSESPLRIEMWPGSRLERLLAERPALIEKFQLRARSAR